jgi:hypothetical protein
MQPLPFPPTQVQYDNWYASGEQRVALDPDFYQSDLMDGNIMVLTAFAIEAKYPHLRRRLTEVVPDCVERAMADLGMFGGAGHLAEQVGLPADEVQELMMGTFAKS